jgi:sarcosine oxidase, subunit delta
MLLVTCPFCGPRNENEFVCTGETVARPAQPAALDDTAWTGFLYLRDNTKGRHEEHWWHKHGCRQWFRAMRSTADNRFTP